MPLPAVGATLLVPSGPKRHLFVVLTKPSGPDEEILIVGITSVHEHAYCDPACMLQSGEHDFIGHASYVNYRFARILSGQRIRDCLASGEFTLLDPVTPALLERIEHGLVMSRHTRPRIGTFHANRPD